MINGISNFDISFDNPPDQIEGGSLSGSIGKTPDFISKTTVWSDFKILTVLDGEDTRTTELFTKTMPERLVCALRIYSTDNKLFHGSAWMAGPSLVMTCGHNVHHDKFGGWAERIEVIPGLSEAERPVEQIVTDRFSTHKRWFEGHEEAYDIGCIHLDKPIGKALGWFAVARIHTPQSVKGRSVVCAGYPEYQAEFTRQRRGTGQIIEVAGTRIYHKVDTNDGQSGGPIWLEAGDEAPPTAIGIHTYEKKNLVGPPPEEANSGTLIDSEMFELITWWNGAKMPV